jgi:lauroyl/myristoyl acyltransferase
VRHRLEHLIVKGLINAVRVLPDACVRALGHLVGLAFYTLDRAHRRIAEPLAERPARSESSS